MNRSQSAEENWQMQAVMADPDLRFEIQTIAVVEYRALSIYDEVLPVDLRSIA